MLIRDFQTNKTDTLDRYLHSRRSDALLLMPNEIFSTTVSKLDKLRELVHIFRPLIYISAYTFSRDRRQKIAIWSVSLALELFAVWPEISSMLVLSKKEGKAKSRLQEGEEHSRLCQLLFFLLREPIYSEYSRLALDSVKSTFAEWRILRPITDTANAYQKLCETVYFYTSSS